MVLKWDGGDKMCKEAHTPVKITTAVKLVAPPRETLKFSEAREPQGARQAVKERRRNEAKSRGTKGKIII
jgi:hypothetical protein